MSWIVTHTALTAILATFAIAQAPQTSNQTTSPAGGQPAAGQSTATTSGSGQTHRGILMDASCQVIQNRSTGAAGSSADASPSRLTPSTTSRTTASAAGVTPGATTGATPPSSTDAAAPAAVKEAASRPVTSPQTAAATGVNPSHAGQPQTTDTTPPTTARSTASAAAAGSSGSSVTTYSGPRATANSPASPATTHIGSDNATGERSRSADTADAGWTTVREKYKDCRVTPTTTSFALMSNGKLYMVDDASGLLRQKMNSSSGNSEWHTVTITGTMTGDRISTSSVQ